VSPRAWAAEREAFGLTDVTALLSSVAARTLVVQDRGDAVADFSTLAPQLAAGIPSARFVATDDVARAVDNFLRGGPAGGSAAPLASGTAIILFADIVGSTALAEQLGDVAFRQRSRVLEARVRDQMEARAGTPVAGRTLGDGVLGTFGSAADAIGAAMACAVAAEEVGLGLHLGLHAGDVMRESANVYGQAVSIASRVSGLSAPNEVLVSGTVRDLARASAGVLFEDRGEHLVKGVADSIRVFAVHRSDG
jgi:class 3 adenylate cyclase